MIHELVQAIRFTIVTMVLFGGGYPLVVWGIAQAVQHDQAQGSLIQRPDGSIAGSRLIAQAFTEPRYFHPRPSAVDYNAASAGGSNSATTGADHLVVMRERMARALKDDPAPIQDVPSEMITASGAGLDPHIPPAAAALQVARVANARQVDPASIRELVRSHTEPPTFGLLGRARINVLDLNIALDQAFPVRQGPRP